jgi:hypothetical protein
MGDKDVTEKLLEDYAEVFADIINVLLLGGNRVIDPINLSDAVKRSMYKVDGKQYSQERDNAKYWNVDGVRIALIGIENQSSVDKEMPIRIIGYDGASYRKQLKDRNDIRRRNQGKPDNEKLPVPPIYPVLTHVLYFGDKHWDDEYKNLRTSFNEPSVFSEYISDYSITVSEIQYLSDETVGMFTSDFKYVAEIFTKIRKVREGVLPKASIMLDDVQHAEEVLDLLTSVIGKDYFPTDVCKQVLEKGGEFDMSPVLEQMREQMDVQAKEELNDLYLWLHDNNRDSDLFKALGDAEFRNSLLDKFKSSKKS